MNRRPPALHAGPYGLLVRLVASDGILRGETPPVWEVSLVAHHQRDANELVARGFARIDKVGASHFLCITEAGKERATQPRDWREAARENWEAPE